MTIGWTNTSPRSQQCVSLQTSDLQLEEYILCSLKYELRIHDHPFITGYLLMKHWFVVQNERHMWAWLFKKNNSIQWKKYFFFFFLSNNIYFLYNSISLNVCSFIFIIWFWILLKCSYFVPYFCPMPCVNCWVVQQQASGKAVCSSSGQKSYCPHRQNAGNMIPTGTPTETDIWVIKLQNKWNEWFFPEVN